VKDTKKYNSESTRAKLQRSGLSDMVRIDGNRILTAFDKYLKDLHATRRTDTGDAAENYPQLVGKIAAFMLRRQVEEKFNLKFLIRNVALVKDFGPEYQKATESASSMQNYYKAMKEFLTFILAYQYRTIPSEQDDRTLKALRTHIGTLLLANRKRGRIQLSTKKVNTLRKGLKFTFPEVIQFLEGAQLTKKLNAIVEKGIDFDRDDYIFMTGFLMTSLVLRTAQRTQVVKPKKLTLKAWNDRVISVVRNKERTSIPLPNTKIAPAVQNVVLCDQEALLINHYMEVMRGRYSEDIDTEKGELSPVFVSTQGAGYKQVSGAIRRFEIAAGRPLDKLFSSTLNRHATATINATQQLSHPEEHRAVQKGMGHNPRTAEEFYTEETVQRAIVGKSVIVRLFLPHSD